jgi:hypothetical protein
MGSSAHAKYDHGYLEHPPPPDAILIIGAGHFGKRAASILRQKSDVPILIVDKDAQSLSEIEGDSVEKIQGDGINFIVKSFPFLTPSNTIIPAVPIHLAFEWLKRYLHEDFRIKQIEVPEEIKPFLPHTWPGNEGSLLISYADFRCPDDCPEPANYCTVTGERRETPLYELLSKIALSNHRVHIIRSHQLASGLGGYKAKDLKNLVDKIREQGAGQWLIGTACKCHGTVTASKIYEK